MNAIFIIWILLICRTPVVSGSPQAQGQGLPKSLRCGLSAPVLCSAQSWAVGGGMRTGPRSFLTLAWLIPGTCCLQPYGEPRGVDDTPGSPMQVRMVFSVLVSPCAA